MESLTPLSFSQDLVWDFWWRKCELRDVIATFGAVEMDRHFSSVYTSTFCLLNVFSLTHHLVISCVILPAILRPSGTFFPLIWLQLPITPYAFPKLNLLSIRIYIKIYNLLAWHDLCLLGLHCTSELLQFLEFKYANNRCIRIRDENQCPFP